MRRRLPRFLVCVILATVVAVVVAAAPVGAGSSAGGSDERLQRRLDDLVAADGGPPGALVVVQRGNEQQVFSAGVADLATGAPLDPHQHLRVASVAKAFSGAAALALVDQGVLSLDDTIAQRLPQYEKWGEVRLRDLLAHRSGVPKFITHPAFAESVQAAPETPLPPAELISPVGEAPLAFEPGTEYRYTNTDNILVGLMIEQATGRPYEDVLRTEVYEPLGLTQTSLPRGVELPEPFVHGYDVTDPAAPEDVSLLLAAGWAWAAGGIVSTPAEMDRFVRGYVGGELFGPELVDEQHDDLRKGRSDPPGPGKSREGMALFRYDTRCGTVYGHTGNTLGYTHLVAASPDGDRSVTFSINAQITPESSDVFPRLRKVQEAAVCLALGDE